MKNSTPDQRWDYYTGILFVLIGAISFSAKAVIIKLAYAYGAHVDAITLMTLRMVMALPFFITVAFWTQRHSSHKPLNRNDWIAIIYLGITGYYLASLLDFKGLQLISAGLERLILFLYPTFVVLFSALILKRRIHRSEILALLLSYSGILFVVLENISVESEKVITGSLLILGSAVAFAIFLLGSGEMIKRIGSTRFTAYAMTVSCLVTMIHYAMTHHFVILALPQQVYGLAFMLAIISTVIPAFLMNAGIRRIGASSTAILSSIGPISTLLIAYYLLDETVNNVQLTGTALVLLGVYLAGRSRAP